MTASGHNKESWSDEMKIAIKYACRKANMLQIKSNRVSFANLYQILILTINE